MSKEILMVVDAVSNEKGVEKDIIFEAIEVALATATKKRYDEDSNITVNIDRLSGDYETFRTWEVVDDDTLAVLRVAALIGTLIGLVQMLRTLDDPSQIGGGMATALLTTLYGAIIANLFCIPLAGKLDARNKEEILIRELKSGASRHLDYDKLVLATGGSAFNAVTAGSYDVQVEAIKASLAEAGMNCLAWTLSSFR